VIISNINTSSYLYGFNNFNFKSTKSKNSKTENNLNNQCKSKLSKLPVLTHDHIIYFTSLRSIRRLNAMNYKKLEVAIYGHSPNDLDSIVSSYALTDLYKKLGYNFNSYFNGKTIPGDIKYVFGRFGKKQHGGQIPENISNVDLTKVLSGLVDHHDPNQSVDKSIIKRLKVIGIWDHHLLAKNEKLKVKTGIWSHYLKPKTKKPMVKSGIHNYSLLSKTKKTEIKEEVNTYSRIEKIGATATMITNIYGENRIKINKDTAGLILSAILSDTLNLCSSTTINKDREAVEKLGRIIWKSKFKKHTNNLYHKIIKAKSDSYDTMSTKELINSDLKKYDGDIFIGQIFPCSYDWILQRKSDIIKILHEMEKENKMNGIVLMATYPKEDGWNTILYFTNHTAEIVKKGYKLKKLEGNEFDLGKTISEKEDIKLSLGEIISRKEGVKPYLIGVS